MDIKLNVGNLWTYEFLDKVIELNDQYKDEHIQITSLYGSSPGMTASARSSDRIPIFGWDFVSDYVKKARDNNIHIRWTLNQSCVGPIQDFHAIWNKSLEHTVHKLISIGVDQWTIASPLIMELMVDTFDPREAYLEASTIAEVGTVAELERWASIGADAVNVSIMSNRDFRQLRNMQKRADILAITLTLLANEACLWRCPWRRECYNLSSHDSNRSPKYFNYYPFQRCNAVRLAHPDEWLKARMILPQWMRTYVAQTGIRDFKVTGRTATYDVAVPVLAMYMSQYHGGNLVDLWPTISHLGNTDEPTKSTFIPCEALDRMGFLGAFINGMTCNHQVCGFTCTYCRDAYAEASIAAQT